MNKTNKLLMFFLILMFSSNVFSLSPKEIITAISDKSTSAMDKQKGEESRKAIRSFIDFEVLAKDSLGKQWQKISPKEKIEFKNTLQEIIERTV